MLAERQQKLSNNIPSAQKHPKFHGQYNHLCIYVIVLANLLLFSFKILLCIYLDEMDLIDRSISQKAFTNFTISLLSSQPRRGVKRSTKAVSIQPYLYHIYTNYCLTSQIEIFLLVGCLNGLTAILFE